MYIYVQQLSEAFVEGAGRTFETVTSVTVGLPIPARLIQVVIFVFHLE